jgi:hypothetical protein
MEFTIDIYFNQTTFCFLLKSDFQESTSEPNTLLNVVDSLENYDIKLSTEKNCFILDFISTLDNIIKLKTV